jgi:hypothetical protein
VIQSSGAGYVGPRGEYYSSFPSVYQLQSVYSTGASNPIVTAPVNVTQSSQADGQEVSVNISPDRAILIKKVDNGYTGPLGELYPNIPTVQQLQISYGSVSDEQIQAANQNMALKSQLLNDQVTRNMDAQTKMRQLQQQQINQQIQQSEKEMDDRQKQWKEDAKKEQQKAQFQSEHPFGMPTPAQKRKDAQDWVIYYFFEGSLLIISIGFLVFILLLHLPNRLIGPDHPVHELPLAIAVRRGMTKAKFNENVSKLIFFEVLVITIFVGVGFKSFLAFFIAVFIGIVLMNIKTSAFVLMYLFSTFWMLAAAQIGYLLCGGQFANMGNYVSAWIGGLIVAALGFCCAFGIHTAGLQYYEDINS